MDSVVSIPALQMTNALSAELKIERLMGMLARKVQTLLNAERCTVFIVDPDARKKELYTSDTMSYGMGKRLPIDGSKTTFIRFPIDRGIAGSVATTGKMINLKDVYEDPRFNRQMDLQSGYRTRSLLCIPIVAKIGQMGVIQAINKRDDLNGFTEADVALLSAFSSQAALAINNSNLFTSTENALNHVIFL